MQSHFLKAGSPFILSRFISQTDKNIESGLFGKLPGCFSFKKSPLVIGQPGMNLIGIRRNHFNDVSDSSRIELSVPDRNAVSPPKLTADTPVPFLFKPALISTSVPFMIGMKGQAEAGRASPFSVGGIDGRLSQA